MLDNGCHLLQPIEWETRVLTTWLKCEETSLHDAEENGEDLVDRMCSCCFCVIKKLFPLLIHFL